jgi:hypothetical protein
LAPRDVASIAGAILTIHRVQRDRIDAHQSAAPSPNKVWQLMQLFLCQTSLPRVTSGVILSLWVRAGN